MVREMQFNDCVWGNLPGNWYRETLEGEGSVPHTDRDVFICWI